MAGWVTPPPGAPQRRVNAAHPLAKELRYAFWGGEMARADNSSSSSTPAPDYGPYRLKPNGGSFDSRDVARVQSPYFGCMGTDLASRNANHWLYSVPPEWWPIQSTGGLTMVLWGEFSNATFSYPMYNIGTSYGFTLYRTSGTSMRWMRGTSSSQRANFSTGWPNASWKGMLVVTDTGVQASSGNNVRVWHNNGGPMTNVVSGDINGIDLRAPTNITDFRVGTTTGNSMPAIYRFMGLWGRVLTDDEIKRLPWTIYDPWMEDDLVEVMTGLPAAPPVGGSEFPFHRYYAGAGSL